MDGEVPERAARALDRHDAFEPAGSGQRGRGDGSMAGEPSPTGAGGYAVTTTPFDAEVTVTETDASALRYIVSVRVPMLSRAARDDVGPAVEDGWFETLELRLADAPMATREAVDLDTFDLSREDGTAVARFAFVHDRPDAAAGVAKTLVEYVEGTYVEGVVPGYAYDEPVAGLLARASDGDGDSSRGPTPL